jgi:glycosyltransferase involved in cell wall biosynthesis
MHIAVVVPVRNAQPQWLRRCLYSISQACVRSRDVPTTIVVSDDQSDEPLCQEYSRLALIHHAEYVRSRVWHGIGGARNLGVAHVRSVATHVLFVDADDEVDSHAIAAMAEAATAGSIVTAFYLITGRGPPYMPPKAALLRLAETHHGSRTSPLLHMNVIGQPALVPLEAFQAVNGYVERRYSGEHVDLWGRLLLGSVVRKVSLLPRVLYRYHSSADGNYRRRPLLHRRGVATALQALARRYFNDYSDYAWVASGRPLPTLYAPISQDGTLRLPPWALLDRDRWRLQAACHDRLVKADLCVQLHFRFVSSKAVTDAR